MLIKTAIKKAKAQEEEKVAISLKVPNRIKTQLQSIADKHNISLNNLCVSILESVLDGNIDSQGTMELIRQLDEAKESLREAEGYLNGGVDSFPSNKGYIVDFNVERMVAMAKIASITSELNKRGDDEQ